ncbi:ATP-binding protein [Metallibacterium scheffleri]|uniref:ATP-binding protein n=1 Tax=Metallibacterium scheffleri TaxID=993689 RepID=UPI0023F4FD66|nr:ATP-binding protein [Metallibacterium scheffleri]
MGVERTWVEDAIDAIENTKIRHHNYELTRARLAASCRATFRGELIVLVGPSRVGKTRCIRDALNVPRENIPDANAWMRVVVVDAGNDSRGGEFSTKGFMAECLRGIHHPIYGMPAEDDPWEEHLQAKIHRAPEAMLRMALENALARRRTEYFVIDEAHHVRYAPGGDAAAARILDSYKCLANRTNIKLVLAGSYEMLSLLTLAPHLLGRQQPLEFSRYRSDSRLDVSAWEQVLRKFSESMRFRDNESLSSWNRYLFDGSHGCVGQLSRWLRAALATLLSDGGDAMTQEILTRCRLPAAQEASILAEIQQGERHMQSFSGSPREATAPQSHPMQSEAGPPGNLSAKGKAPRKPFQRSSKRNKVGGRA